MTARRGEQSIDYLLGHVGGISFGGRGKGTSAWLVNGTFWAFAPRSFKLSNEGILGRGNFPGFLNGSVFILEFHGAPINSDKTKAMVGEELL